MVVFFINPADVGILADVFALVGAPLLNSLTI
jgi:hypothetical protein